MGIMMISAMVKQSGHQSFLLVENLESDFDKKICELEPDIIAFSATTGSHNWVCDTAERIKPFLKSKIILGGSHATFFPEVIYKKGVDIICRGEGEHAIVELLEKLSKKEPVKDIKNFWVKENGEIYKNDLRPLIQNLDSLPFFDRSLYNRYSDLKLYYEHHMFVMTSRGCPFNCSYCFNISMRQLYPRQTYIRKRSVDNVISELKEIKNNYQPTGIQFLDDIFILDHDWLEQFCEVYKKEIGLPFTCIGHVNYINRRVAAILKNAGCLTIKMGLEAGNNHLRRNILNRNISKEKIYEACRIIKEENLDLLLFNMMGFPGSSLKEEFETVDMNLKIKPEYALCFMANPYPGTGLTEYAIKNGYLEADFDFDNLANSVFSTTPFKLKNKDQVINLHKFFMLLIAFPFLRPLVTLLIKLPPNKIYYTIFQFYYAYVIRRADRLSFIDFVRFGLRTKSYFSTSHEHDRKSSNNNTF